MSKEIKDAWRIFKETIMQKGQMKFANTALVKLYDPYLVVNTADVCETIEHVDQIIQKPVKFEKL